MHISYFFYVTQGIMQNILTKSAKRNTKIEKIEDMVHFQFLLVQGFWISSLTSILNSLLICIYHIFLCHTGHNAKYPCSTNMVTKLPTQAVCVQPFLSFTIIHFFSYHYSLRLLSVFCFLFCLLPFLLYFCLFFIYPLSFLLFVFVALNLSLFLLCLCQLIILCIFLHFNTLLIEIQILTFFLVLGRAGPDVVGLTSL